MVPGLREEEILREKKSAQDQKKIYIYIYLMYYKYIYTIYTI